MPELDLPACPICLAENRLSLNTIERAGERFTWYRCRECASDLLSIGHGRWVYKKIGRERKSDLLLRPLTTAQLRQLLAAPVAAPQAAPRTRPERRKALSPVIVGAAIAVGIFLGGVLLLTIVRGIRLGPDPVAAAVATEVSSLPTSTATSTPTMQPSPTATRIPRPRHTPTPCPAGSAIVIGHWQIQVRQILIADSVASAYGDEVEEADGRFVLLFMTVTNRSASPDTFVAFATLEIQDAEGRRYAEDSVATHYAQATHRTSLAVDIAPRTGAYIVVVYDISRRSESYTLVPGALASEYAARVLLDIP